jgi:hypothetical protein
VSEVRVTSSPSDAEVTVQATTDIDDGDLLEWKFGPIGIPGLGNAQRLAATPARSSTSRA